jgi:hypothetical protein
MRQIVFVTVVLSLATTGFAQAWDWEMLGITGDLHGYLEFAIQSKYIWRGFDPYNDHAAFQAAVDLDLFQTGFGLNVMAHKVMEDGFENAERWDYTLYYQNALFEAEAYETNYRIGWVYYNYPDHKNEWYDLQEIQGVLSWPNALPVEGLIPSYVIVGLWPSTDENLYGGNASGWAHIFMLDYRFMVPSVLPQVPEQPVNLHGELVYNDGIGPAPIPGGLNVDHDWTNFVLGVSTDLDVGYNMMLTPALYYQRTMEVTLGDDDSDETWATLSARYSF